MNKKKKNKPIHTIIAAIVFIKAIAAILFFAYLCKKIHFMVSAV